MYERVLVCCDSGGTQKAHPIGLSQSDLGLLPGLGDAHKHRFISCGMPFHQCTAPGSLHHLPGRSISSFRYPMGALKPNHRALTCRMPPKRRFCPRCNLSLIIHLGPWVPKQFFSALCNQKTLSQTIVQSYSQPLHAPNSSCIDFSNTETDMCALCVERVTCTPMPLPVLLTRPTALVVRALACLLGAV